MGTPRALPQRSWRATSTPLTASALSYGTIHGLRHVRSISTGSRLIGRDPLPNAGEADGLAPTGGSIVRVDRDEEAAPRLIQDRRRPGRDGHRVAELDRLDRRD